MWDSITKVQINYHHLAHKFYIYRFHARIQKILSEKTLQTFFFLVDEGWVDPNSTLSAPSSARQRTAI